MAATNSAQQKVIVQKMAAGSPAAVMAATSSSVLTTQSLPNQMKGVVAQTTPLKMLQSTTQSQATQISAGGQFTTGHPITNVFTLNGNQLTQQTPISVAAGAQCNVSAQTVVVSQMQPQITTQVSTVVSTHQVMASNGVTTNVVASPMAQQLQQTGRQVKVIKTVPHLQSVIGSKPTAQLHLQHPYTSVITTSTVVTDTSTTAAAGSAAPNVNVVQQQQNVPAQQLPVATTVLSAATTASGTAMATTGAAAAAAAAVAAAAASANVTSSTATTAVSTASTIVTPVRTVDLGQFLCEWRSCMRYV